MSALEEEIIKKFRLLDGGARLRVLRRIEEETTLSEPSMTAQEWLAWVRDFRARLRHKYGERTTVSSVDLLNEAREERLNDLMGGG